MRMTMAVGLVWLCASMARADALPPPEDIECREGEVVQHDHSGTHCELPSCQTDADCPEGASCPELRCVAFVPNPDDACRGRPKGPPDPCAPIAEDRGPCRAEEPRCDEGAACRSSQCVWDEDAAGSPGDVGAGGGSTPRGQRSTGPGADDDAPPASAGGGCCGSSAARARGVAPFVSLVLLGAVFAIRVPRR